MVAEVEPVPVDRDDEVGLHATPAEGISDRSPHNYPSCPGSVTGHAQNDASGRCCWCGAWVDPPVPHRMPSRHRTELDTEYRRAYDPDFGTNPLDV